MKRKINTIYTICLTAITLLASQTQHVFAWGDEGHKVIAAIAYSQLTPEAKSQVDNLLSKDEDTLTEPDFISRSTWADRYRDSDRQTTKNHYKATHKWHFVDLEVRSPDFMKACYNYPRLDKNQLASESTPNNCITDKIMEFAKELKSPNTPTQEKIIALKFLIHFIGDVHQPLHAATDSNDSGGNAVSVRYFNNQTHRQDATNLHSFWDKDLVDMQGSSVIEIANTLLSDITPAKISSWRRANPVDWALESNKIARESAYNFYGLKSFSDKKANTGYELDSRYIREARVDVKTQLQKAAIRLADILNIAMRQN